MAQGGVDVELLLVLAGRGDLSELRAQMKRQGLKMGTRLPLEQVGVWCGCHVQHGVCSAVVQ